MVATLPGAVETKVRPAVVVASDGYLREHRDIMVGILTTKVPPRLTAADFVLEDWQAAGLRAHRHWQIEPARLGASKTARPGSLRLIAAARYNQTE